MILPANTIPLLHCSALAYCNEEEILTSPHLAPSLIDPATIRQYTTDDEMWSAIVGKSPFGTIVAFRGTQPENWSEWLSDASCELVRSLFIHGRWHRGFSLACNELYCRIPDFCPSDGPVISTGHSAGGAMAQAFMAFCDACERSITFAAPMLGNAEFADWFDANHPCVRVEHAGDIVPHLPPNADLLGLIPQIDYRPVGSVVTVGTGNALLATPEQRIADHSIAAYLAAISG